MYIFQNKNYDGFPFYKENLQQCIIEHNIKYDGRSYYLENGSVKNKDGVLEIIKNYIYPDTIVLKGANFFSVEVDEVKMI